MAAKAEFHHYAVASAFALPFFLKPTSKFAAFTAQNSAKLGLSALNWSARASLRSVGAVATTSFVRGGTFNPAKLAGSVAAGYALGAGVLLGISQYAYGDEGFSNAMDFIKDPFDIKKVNVVGSALKQTLWDSWSL